MPQRSDEEADDPHQAAIDQRFTARTRRKVAKETAAPDEPVYAVVTHTTPAREGTPDAAPAAGELAGESTVRAEMRRLLRQPRYFDADFEAAAQRCFRCGGSGHRERDCAAPPRDRPCFLCGLFGHVSRDCPAGLCFNCALPGHLSRDCTQPRGAAAQRARCLRCGSRSHTAPACDRDYDQEDLDAMTCYVCGEAGHLCCAPPPADVPDATCFRCGAGGHFGYECVAFVPPPQRFGGDVCFRCNGRGHQARNCPAAAAARAAGTAGMGFARRDGGAAGDRQVSWVGEKRVRDEGAHQRWQD